MGATPEHYRCYQIFIPKTQGTRICDTVEFFPTHCQIPHVPSHDAVLYAANHLITASTKPQLTNSGISVGDDQIVALRKIATIFQCSIKKKHSRTGRARQTTTATTMYSQSNKSLRECSHTSPIWPKHPSAQHTTT